ncbi:MAG: hypothetical protein AAF623_02005, partial [Planctomycetota bacterium]
CFQQNASADINEIPLILSLIFDDKNSACSCVKSLETFFVVGKKARTGEQEKFALKVSIFGG